MIDFLLKIESALGKPKGAKFTRYHLDSQAKPASKRFNGRTRGSLPIDNPTPRPFSAMFYPCPLSPYRAL
jgi:hypothetical protein